MWCGARERVDFWGKLMGYDGIYLAKYFELLDTVKNG